MLVSGALAVMLGGMVVLWPDISIGVAAVLFGDYLVASGAMRGWTVPFGIITAVAGVTLMALPLASIVTLAIVVGICLVVLGAIEIICSYEIRMSVKEFSRIDAGTTDRS